MYSCINASVYVQQVRKKILVLIKTHSLKLILILQSLSWLAMEPYSSDHALAPDILKVATSLLQLLDILCRLSRTL